jgi:PAS domain S-box-containing protein
MYFSHGMVVGSEIRGLLSIAASQKGNAVSILGGNDMNTNGKNAPVDSLSLELLVDRLEDKESIINAISDAVMVLDTKNYTILEANQAFLNSYNLDSSWLVGKTCYETTHHHSKPCSQVLAGVVCPLEMAISTGKTCHVEHVHADSEGNRRYFEITAYPIKAATGEVSRIVHIGKDVTDRRLAEEASRSNEEKTRLFAYSIAHDLKGPAIVIRGLAERLCKARAMKLDEKEKTYCSHMLRASEQIVSLLDSIHSFISAREAVLTPKQMKLREVLQVIKEEFSPELNARKIKWLEPESDPEIKADELSITRVLRNLLDNALKYGGEGISQIRVGYEESANSHIISVSDNGVGLGKDSLARIFRPFERDPNGREIDGSGLGLAIVEEIARQHGGEAWAESQIGRGTTFYVRILKEPGLSKATANMKA